MAMNVRTRTTYGLSYLITLQLQHAKLWNHSHTEDTLHAQNIRTKPQPQW